MDILDLISNNNVIPPFLSGKGIFNIDEINGISLLISAAYRKKKGKYLVVTSNLYKAQKIYFLIASFLGDDFVSLFPCDEFIRMEAVGDNKEMNAQRLYTLNSIINKKCDIVIANVHSVMKYISSPSLFSNFSFNFKVGDHIEISTLRKKLVESGYTYVSKIDQSLQFAIRGDIIDIFSVNQDNPIRIELFDDEIESIRYFDISTQTSFKKINEVTILPANEYLLNDLDIKNGIERLNDLFNIQSQNLTEDLKGILRNNLDEDIANLMERNSSYRVKKYFSFLSSAPCTLFDFTTNFTKIFVNPNQIKEEINLVKEETSSYISQLEQSCLLLKNIDTLSDFSSFINEEQSLLIDPYCDSLNYLLLNNVPYISSKEGDAIKIIQLYLDQAYKLMVSVSTNEQYFLITEALSKLGISYEKVKGLTLSNKCNISISVSSFEQGFDFKGEKIAILTAKELFNIKVHSIRFTSKFKEATILKSFEELNEGDFVVHEYYGIGQYVCLQTLEIDGMHKDHIKIQYANGDFLYVPLSQFQLVRKYMGKEGYHPKLSRLHSKDWEIAKRKAKERINLLADRLLNLYSEREKIKGFAFFKDDELQKEFESGFEHSLTKDQERSLMEIKLDMEKESPMDRLLCGDVGFGKTEIAFRAAFKAISSGKQVAILCPTTILARQHYERALERFSPYDVKIAMFSRFVSKKQEKINIQGVFGGKIHLIIGTHKLLNKNIVFKDLGLLIVDEEQRFGVEQKERLKEIKNNVDVLTLSATPIPRTLQISMIGIRSMSLINSAPSERLPVQTYVLPQKDEMIKELIERELGRNGQVFYLHNNIETLPNVAKKISTLVPDAVIGVAHGRMDKNDVEDIMMRFYNNEINVLICTSIVENGIDVPNANMMIIEDADTYGLSQLYQIKGRVGRSDRIAYAYLMYKPYKKINEKALKRLDAIKEFTSLGSGYRIAQRDLMIRGAGDILGPDQAGFIDCIGLDMYVKLLNETVKEKLGEEKETLETSFVDLSVDAYIPSTYAKDSDKIEIYHDINSANTIEELLSLKIKISDVFGKFPNNVEYLFKRREIEIYKAQGDIEKVNIKKDFVEITLGEKILKVKGAGNLLFETLYPFSRLLRISYTNKRFLIRMDKRVNWIEDLISILRLLSSIIIK